MPVSVTVLPSGPWSSGAVSRFNAVFLLSFHPLYFVLSKATQTCHSNFILFSSISKIHSANMFTFKLLPKVAPGSRSDQEEPRVPAELLAEIAKFLFQPSDLVNFCLAVSFLIVLTFLLI